MVSSSQNKTESEHTCPETRALLLVDTVLLLLYRRQRAQTVTKKETVLKAKEMVMGMWKKYLAPVGERKHWKVPTSGRTLPTLKWSIRKMARVMRMGTPHPMVRYLKKRISCRWFRCSVVERAKVLKGFGFIVPKLWYGFTSGPTPISRYPSI